MGEWTKGPWRANDRVIESDDGYLVAKAAVGVRSDIDARLIAAAPDLAEALRDLRGACEQVYATGRIPAEPFVRAGNVLAKAEGR